MPLKLTTQAKSPTWSPTSWVRAAQLVILCLFWEKKLQGKYRENQHFFSSFDILLLIITFVYLLTYRKRFVSFVSTFVKFRFGCRLNLWPCLGNKDFRWVELHCRPQCDQRMKVKLQQFSVAFGHDPQIPPTNWASKHNRTRTSNAAVCKHAHFSRCRFGKPEE